MKNLQESLEGLNQHYLELLKKLKIILLENLDRKNFKYKAYKEN